MKYPWKLYLSLGLLPLVPVLVTGAFSGNKYILSESEPVIHRSR